MMSFACQKDSYATSLATRVLPCKPARFDGRDCYEVVLEDTVLFPEGPQAVYYTSQPLEEGSEVRVEMDWRRRFDHMQQHSG